MDGAEVGLPATDASRKILGDILTRLAGYRQRPSRKERGLKNLIIGKYMKTMDTKTLFGKKRRSKL